MLAMEDARALLEVSVHADADAIGRAHRPLSLQHNPDRAGGSNAVPAQRINNAKDLILAEMLPAPHLGAAHLWDRALK